MGFTFGVTAERVPDDDEAAWAWWSRLAPSAGEPGPILEAYVERLLERYPCPTDLPADRIDEGVWSSGPMRNLGTGPVHVFGLVSDRVEDVFPFATHTALDLGLTVFDWQTARIHRPGLAHVRSMVVTRGRRTAKAIATALRSAYRRAAQAVEPLPGSALSSVDLSACALVHLVRALGFHVVETQHGLRIELTTATHIRQHPHVALSRPVLHPLFVEHFVDVVTDLRRRLDELDDRGALGLRHDLEVLDLTALARGAEPGAAIATPSLAARFTAADLVFDVWPELPEYLRGSDAELEVKARHDHLVDMCRNHARLIEIVAPSIIVANEARNVRRAVERLVGTLDPPPGLLGHPPLDPRTLRRLRRHEELGEGWLSDLIREPETVRSTLVQGALTSATDDLSATAARRLLSWAPL